MSESMIIVKHSMRILLRNKAFLFFVVVLPVLSILLLNIKDYSDPEIKTDQNQIYILTSMKERICYDVNTNLLPIKVYDSTGNKLGMEVVKDLETAGLFQLFYCDTSKESFEAIHNDIKRSSMNDKISGILELNDTLESEIKEGEIHTGAIFYDSEVDERTKLFEQAVSKTLGSCIQIAKNIVNEDNFVENLIAAKEMMPTMNTEIIQIAKENNFTYAMEQQLRMIGYFLAVATISFLFSGVLIADTVIKERQYKVFNRFRLTDLTALQYIVAKFIVGLLTVLLQTGVIGIAMKLILKREYAISQPQLLLEVAVVGVIFNLITLCVGIISNNVMNTNYIAFAIWSVTCLVSGCYFDLSDAGDTMRGISNLMPQKWALSSVKMIMSGQSGPYSTLFIAVLAFLIIIGSLGVIGTLKTIQD